MPKYEVDLLGVVRYGMWGSVPEDVAREVWEEYRTSDEPWSNVRPAIAPVIRRHPPTYEEWLLSLPWKPMPVAVPVDDSPDEGRSRLRFRGFRDKVTTDFGRPMRLRFARFELLPPGKVTWIDPSRRYLYRLCRGIGTTPDGAASPRSGNVVPFDPSANCRAKTKCD